MKQIQTLFGRQEEKRLRGPGFIVFEPPVRGWGVEHGFPMLGVVGLEDHHTVRFRVPGAVVGENNVNLVTPAAHVRPGVVLAFGVNLLDAHPPRALSSERRRRDEQDQDCGQV